MTIDPKLEKFCNTVQSLTVTKKWHATPTESGWKGLRQLAAAFWKDGPDVNDDWKNAARRYGYDPEELHEILLGVFLGSDRPEPLPEFDRWYHVTGVFDTGKRDIYVDGKHVNP